MGAAASSAQDEITTETSSADSHGKDERTGILVSDSQSPVPQQRKTRSPERVRFEEALVSCRTNAVCRPGGSYEIGGLIHKLSKSTQILEGACVAKSVERGPLANLEYSGGPALAIGGEVAGGNAGKIVYPPKAFCNGSALAKFDYGAAASNASGASSLEHDAPDESKKEFLDKDGLGLSLNTRLISVAPFHLEGGFIHILDGSLVIRDGVVHLLSSERRREEQSLLWCEASDMIGRGGVGSVLTAHISDDFGECLGLEKSQRFVVKFEPRTKYDDFLSARELTYSEMALQRYIGVVKAEGVPPGLTGVYAYGLALTDEDDLRSVVGRTLTVAEAKHHEVAVEHESAKPEDLQAGKEVLADNQIAPPPEENPPTGYRIYIMQQHSPDMQPLSKLIKRGVVFPEKALRFSLKKIIAKNMIRAVHSLAERQFVHLDIKPSNFLVNPNTGDVRLIDLEGLVNIDQWNRDERIALEWNMSLKYCAPERFCALLRTMRCGEFLPNPDVGFFQSQQEQSL